MNRCHCRDCVREPGPDQAEIFLITLVVLAVLFLFGAMGYLVAEVV